MKKGMKIIWCVLAVLMIGGGTLALRQWNNLSAVRYSFTLEEEEIRQQLEENKQVLNDAMVQYDVPQYDISREVLDQMSGGAVTAEEVAKQLLAQQDSDREVASQPVPAAPPTQTPEQEPTPAQEPALAPTQAEMEIQELIATMYVLRSTYLDKLDQVVQSAIEEYAQGSMTKERRTEVVYARMEQLQAMEKECDERVASVVSRLRELLKQTGQDDTLARQVEEIYANEKSLKKAAYIREFLGE